MKISEKLRTLLIYLVPALIAVAFKAWAIFSAEMPFNADEAIVALMARHINMGQTPIFFYGQSYMGSLDAILIALGFRIFGESVLVIRILQSLLYIGTVLTTILLAKRLLKSAKAALFAGLFLSLPAVNVTLYTTVSLGGYGEMLLIGNLLLLGGLPIYEKIRDKSVKFDIHFYTGLFLWALGAGFAFWVFGLSLVYSLPLICAFSWSALKGERRAELWKAGLAGMMGGFIGSIPWWFQALLKGDLLIFSELAGGALANINQGTWLLQPFSRLINLFIFGGSVIMGLRPPWSIQWLVLPLLPLILVFWIVVFLYSLRIIQDKNRTEELKLIGAIGLILSVGFVLSPYGDDPSGRYFLPLVIPMAIFGSAALVDLLGKKTIWQIGILALVLVYNFAGTLQSERLNSTGITTQFDIISQIDHSHMSELISFLTEEDITRGYTNYWVSYPLAFLSQEELIFVPRLPYHEDFRYTARDDRYAPYTPLVSGSENIAYITTRHPALDEYIREKFEFQDIEWKEKIIGDYQIFYQLSDPIYINDIGLGLTTTP